MASSTSSGRRGRRAGLVALLILGLTPGAWAAGGSARVPSVAVREAATGLLIQGVDRLGKGQYQTALGKFDEAYALVPSPNIHYDRALAYLGLRRNADALAAFDDFLAGAERPPEGTREKAEHHRDDLRGRVAQLDLGDVPSGAAVSVDGRSYGTTPLERSVYLDPGSHELTARMAATGATAVASIAATAGSSWKVTLNFRPPAIATADTPSPAPPLADSPSSARGAGDAGRSFAASHAKGWAVVVSGGGVALLGAGLGFGLLAQREGNGLTGDSSRGSAARPVPYDPQKQANGLRYQTLETVFMGAGAAALVGGVVLYSLYRHGASDVATLPPRRAPARAAWSWMGTPLLGPALVGGALGVSF